MKIFGRARMLLHILVTLVVLISSGDTAAVTSDIHQNSNNVKKTEKREAREDSYFNFDQLQSPMVDAYSHEAQCRPRCHNGGTCVGQQCVCPHPYTGSRCQHLSARSGACTDMISPQSSHTECSGPGGRSYSICKVRCQPGHSFPDGSTTAISKCLNGVWVPNKREWQTIPDCQPICNPPCSNGARCYSSTPTNKCYCTEKFRGPQCQYSVDNCNMNKLVFNGGKDCKGDAESFACKISCPSGAEFEYQPASEYTCTYASAKYTPSSVPQCKYGDLCPSKKICEPGFEAVERNKDSPAEFLPNTQMMEDFDYQDQNDHDDHQHSCEACQHTQHAKFKMITLKCPDYVCVPIARGDNKIIDGHAVCNIQGKIIETFDGLNYEYPICNHILSKQNQGNWQIAYSKSCSEIGQCYKNIVISQNGDDIKLRSDFVIEYNGYTYTVHQANNVGTRSKNFAIFNSGNSIFFKSQIYDFTVSIDDGENIEIKAAEELSGTLSGICGNFNMITNDDGINTRGSLDNFQMPGHHGACSADTCSSDERFQAKNVCTRLTSRMPLIQCNQVFNAAAVADLCVEQYCNCLQYKSPDQCKCDALEKAMRTCQAKLKHIDLSSWREENRCPKTCDKGFVYKDCYRRSCELTCDNAHDAAACPVVEDTCYTGCFCPDNYVRKGDKCVKKQECRNCVCEAYGDPHYTSFDGVKYDFQGQCTYVALQDVTAYGKHRLQVYVTNVECPNYPGTTCTYDITVLYDDHVAYLHRDVDTQQILTKIDNQIIYKFPYVNDWISLQKQSSPLTVTLHIPEIQLEVSYDYNLWKFVVRISPHIFPETEGLCGSCNDNKNDDFKTKDGSIAQNENEFGKSWVVNNLPPGMVIPVGCNGAPPPPPPKRACLYGYPLPAERDPCQWIMVKSTFGKCHALVDPEPYVKDCQFDMCYSTDRTAMACQGAQNYAQKCIEKGVCVDWRSRNRCPYICPAGKIYKPCGSRCEINCNNYEVFQNNPFECSLEPMEGCFCPEGQILLNGHCVSEDNCKACDEEGHVVGDTWNRDACTVCSCSMVGGEMSVRCSMDCAEKRCIVNGKFITTFDGLEYQYKICNHKLIEDKINGLWSVTFDQEKCLNTKCEKVLNILHNSHTIKVDSNLNVEYDRVPYTISQLRSIGKKNKEFQISNLMDSVFFESEIYGFWLLLDNKGKIQLGATKKLFDSVKGLCGDLNGILSDDMTTAQGHLTNNVNEFGNSWVEKYKQATCSGPFCSPVHKTKGLELCKRIIQTYPLNMCTQAMRTEQFIELCVEGMCDCLAHETEEYCVCDASLSFVKTCKVLLPRIDLSSWRADLVCPATTCPPGMVYEECYKRKCQLSCDNLHDKDACPIMDTLCASGCFCPEGLVKSGKTCVKPTECKNCVCDGYGDPHYKTFDGTTYDFQGKCTFVASRDVSNDNRHKYQVLVTNRKCTFAPDTTCTYGVTVLYEGNVISVRRVDDKDKIVTEVDGKKINSFPLQTYWLRIESMPGKKVTIFIPDIQLEVTYVHETYAFSVKLPSQMFTKSIEGLCGNCNNDKSDDMIDASGITRTEPHAFGSSWIVTDLPKGFEEETECTTPQDSPEPLKKCPSLPASRNPCQILMNKAIFGKCHDIVDPQTYLESCEYDVCYSKNQRASACLSVESYARECQRHDVCVDWRSERTCPFECPLGTQYMACGAGCMKTCENYKIITDLCAFEPSEGCYCPEGQVFKDGRCVAESECNVCELQGMGCTTTIIPAIETIGLITETNGRNGKCTNKSPIPGFKGCSGFCKTKTVFRYSEKETAVSDGQCCQPLTFDLISVELTCENRYRYQKDIRMPNSCICSSCNDSCEAQTDQCSLSQGFEEIVY